MYRLERKIGGVLKKRPSFKSSLFCLLATSNWANYSTSLCWSFLPLQTVSVLVTAQPSLVRIYHIPKALTTECRNTKSKHSLLVLIRMEANTLLVRGKHEQKLYFCEEVKNCRLFLFHYLDYMSYQHQNISKVYQAQVKICFMTNTDATNLPVGHTKARG